MSEDFRMDFDDSVLRRLIDNTPDELDTWLDGVTDKVLNDIVESFDTSPAGEVYWSIDHWHVASIEGYPPNVDWGVLRASMKKIKNGYLRYLIMDGTDYGVHLELGSENMGPRPFIIPAIEYWQTEIVNDASNAGLIDGN